MEEINEYGNVLTEVYTILQCLDEDTLKKIPEEVIEAIRNNRNLNYNYSMNEDMDLDKQEMLPDTKAMLSNIFRDYLASPKERQEIITRQEEERKANEELKREKYKTNLFENNNEGMTEKLEISENVDNYPTEQNENGFWKKILKKITKIFVKK